jgi:hypothetical protein
MSLTRLQKIRTIELDGKTVKLQIVSHLDPSTLPLTLFHNRDD